MPWLYEKRRWKNGFNGNLLFQMQKTSKRVIKAKEMEGKSVVYSRKEVVDEAVITLRENPEADIVLFGVKNTNQIDKHTVETLQKIEGFLFHTVDKMSERGRAIDVDIINPLTGRVMTGSSSGGCANILRGVNDIAIATDGGGSVIAPAISTGLYSIMAKGMGLKGSSQKKSTDNIVFTPGIGVISHNYDLCVKAVEVLTGETNNIDKTNIKSRKIRVAIPKKGAIILPNGIDMRRIIDKAINKAEHMAEFVEVDVGELDDRNNIISTYQKITSKGIDMIMTAEGPIDVFGIGDSVLGIWGETGKSIQNKSGKYFLKVANMVDATTVSIPTQELGISILLVGKTGIESGKNVIGLGNIIKDTFDIPQLFSRYFIDSYKDEGLGYI